jgi:hypothetical protein
MWMLQITRLQMGTWTNWKKNKEYLEVDIDEHWIGELMIKVWATNNNKPSWTDGYICAYPLETQRQSPLWRIAL